MRGYLNVSYIIIVNLKMLVEFVYFVFFSCWLFEEYGVFYDNFKVDIYEKGFFFK